MDFRHPNEGDLLWFDNTGSYISSQIKNDTTMICLEYRLYVHFTMLRAHMTDEDLKELESTPKDIWELNALRKQLTDQIKLLESGLTYNQVILKNLMKISSRFKNSYIKRKNKFLKLLKAK